MPVVCINNRKFHEKLEANILNKKLARHLEIEKTKTKPGNWLHTSKIPAKIENSAKIEVFPKFFVHTQLNIQNLGEL